MRRDMMANKKKFGAIFASALVSLCVLLELCLPIISYASDETIYIGTKEELLSFAKSCSYDEWSKGKSFKLTADISLEGEDFAPIPSFSGSFDGAGHTISGINIEGAYSPAGLFGVVEGGATIKNLKVQGVVAPSGDKGFVGGIVGDNSGTIENCIFEGSLLGVSDAGGIAGINRTFGTIASCSTSGEIVGEYRTGGIAGSNEGMITSSVNMAKVNTISIDPSISLDEINISLTLDITKLPSISNITMSDTGGVAGYSIGFILGCKNYGEIGYPHIGYNVGGIAGRSTGHLASNENSADVYGRKDVGGIVGQMEPYVQYNLSEDLLAALKGELDTMHDLVEDAIDIADLRMPTVSQKIDNINSLLGDAGKSLDKLTGYIGNYVDDLTYTANSALSVLKNTISIISGIVDTMNSISGNLTDSIGSLEKALNAVNISENLTDEEKAALTQSLGNAKKAIAQMNNGLDKIGKGIKSLENAIEINDPDAIEKATADIEAGLEDLSTAFENFAASMEWFENVSSATNKIVSGIETIIDNIYVDFDNVSEELPLVSEGLGDISAGVSDLIDALENAATVLGESDALANFGKNITVSLSDALLFMNQALGDMSTMITQTKSLTDYLNKTNIRLPYINSKTSSEADKLFLAMSNLEIEIADLTSEISMLGSEISPIVREMNDCFSRISNNIINIIYGFSDTNIFDDEVTEDEVMEITYGKIFSCNNGGNINGDINVGGISGVISMEYELDPEDDLSNDLSITQKKHYELKAVIHRCQNRGDVVAKRDSAGGVVGKMDFGLVFGCEAYCNVKSEAGNYVGGIAGITAGKVSDCFAKCSLAGGKYIGGIVGSGVTEDISGASSMVVGCYSIVEISSYKQYAGAISGANAGDFSGNYFVSESLAGIDRISYHGKAQYISYQDLVKRRIIPDGFYSFDLEFVADGVVIKKVNFEYGTSFDNTVFPEIPKKEGYFSAWDTNDLTNLVFDTVVTAVYTPYVTSLGSDEVRDNGKNIFFVEGNFTDEDKINVYKSEISTVFDADGFSLLDNKTREQWVIEIPKGASEIHNVHFLPDVKKCNIYIKSGEEWIEALTSEYGSYITFDATGDRVEIAVVVRSVNAGALLLLVGGVLILAAGTIVAIIIMKRASAAEKSDEPIPEKPKKEKKQKAPKADKEQRAKKEPKAKKKNKANK